MTTPKDHLKRVIQDILASMEAELRRYYASQSLSMQSHHLQELPSLGPFAASAIDEALLPLKVQEAIGIKAGLPDVTRKFLISEHIVAPFANHYFKQLEFAEFNDEAFEASFTQLEEDLRRRKARVKLLAPLLHLEMASDEIPLDGSTKLRKLKPDEIAAWRLDHRLSQPSSLIWAQLGTLESGAELSFEEEIFARNPELDSRLKAVERVVSFLRLLTDRRIQPVLLAWKSPSMFFSEGMLRSNQRLNPLEKPGRISKAEEAHLRKQWETLTANPKSHRASLALDRFGNTFERTSIEDQILDCWIALEALFLPTQEAELSFRATLRIAHLLGRNAQERTQIYKQMKKSYALRSKVAHGKAATPDDREILLVTRQTLRQALLAVANMNEPFRPDTIEEQLLSLPRADDMPLHDA